MAEKQSLRHASRLWDILTMLRFAASRCDSNIVEFRVSVTLPDKGDWTRYEKMCDGSRTQRLVTLLSEIGPNEYNDPSPVITVSLPDED